jgi:hypothetical protein
LLALDEGSLPGSICDPHPVHRVCWLAVIFFTSPAMTVRIAPPAPTGGLRATFDDVVSSPLPDGLAVLMRQLHADRSERSGEEHDNGPSHRGKYQPAR